MDCSRIDALIEERLHGLSSELDADENRIEVTVLIRQLGAKRSLNDSDAGLLSNMMKKIDITGNIQNIYSSDWKRISGSAPIHEPYLGLLLLLIFRQYLHQKNNCAFSTALQLKYLNCLLKGLDISTGEFSSKSSELSVAVHEELESVLSEIVHADLPVFEYEKKDITEETLQEIPLTVLFSEGPIARAYLATIRSLGLKPRRIINLVSIVDLASRKPVGKWLPLSLRIKYAEAVQRNRIHYWVKQIKLRMPELTAGLSDAVKNSWSFDADVLAGALSLCDLSAYSDRVENLLVSSLKDPALQQYLDQSDESAFLYTGGGIVPAGLLSIQGKQLIHVHPGFLPEIRGADCALWSLLIKGHASASCFYMDPGIDTGDVILPAWLPELQLKHDLSSYDQRMVYRALYSFVDPWIRSYVLREFLQRYDHYDNLPVTPQNPEDGVTFHFMHREMVKKIINRGLCFESL